MIAPSMVYRRSLWRSVTYLFFVGWRQAECVEVGVSKEKDMRRW